MQTACLPCGAGMCCVCHEKGCYIHWVCPTKPGEHPEQPMLFAPFWFEW